MIEETRPLEDVQGRPDERGIVIDQAGVRDLRYPITVLDRARGEQQTIASLSMSVGLPPGSKGTHMSRFVEAIERRRGEVTMRTLPAILRELRERLDAESARVEAKFPYFLTREAPVSGGKALMDYDCSFLGESSGPNEGFILGVKVPVTSLCPCSKAISDYGAHNQRGYVTIEVRPRRTAGGEPELVWIEELVEVGERSGSSPVYPLLKRPDERHVTMRAYDNPVFVEDIVRNVAESLRGDDRISWFRVEAVNQESIHNHNAFAEIEWTRPE